MRSVRLLGGASPVCPNLLHRATNLRDALLSLAEASPPPPSQPSPPVPAPPLPVPAPPPAPVPIAPPVPAPVPSISPEVARYLGQGNRYNCPDFASQALAQAVLRADPTDPNQLDTDRDGIACENNPPPRDVVRVPR